MRSTIGDGPGIGKEDAVVFGLFDGADREKRPAFR